MRSRRAGRPGRVVIAAVLAAATAGAWPVVTSAQAVDCAAPDLAGIEAEMAVARAAVVAGNTAALEAAITSAQAQLAAIAEACFGAARTPAPSLPPIDLTGSATVGGRPVAFPGDLEVVEDAGLLRPVDRDGLVAETLTVADSQTSGTLLSSQPEEPVPSGFRVISLAVGGPAATLASVGAIDADQTVPDEPLAALDALVTAIEAEASDGDIGIIFTEPGAVTFGDGAVGAAVDLRIRDAATDETLVAGMFQLLPLPDGDWALGVAFASAEGVEQIRGALSATLASIGSASIGSAS